MWINFSDAMPVKGDYIWLVLDASYREGCLDADILIEKEEMILVYVAHVNQFGVSFLDPLNPSRRLFTDGKIKKFKRFMKIEKPIV